MKLKKNTRLLGSGRLSSVTASSENIDAFIADKSVIGGRRFSIKRQVVTSLGRVSFAEDYYDLGFAKAERRMKIKTIPDLSRSL